MSRNLAVRFDTQIALCSALGVTATMTAATQQTEAFDYVYYQPNNGAGWVVPDTTEGLYVNVETRVTGATRLEVPGWDVDIYSQPSLLSFYRTATNGSFYMKYSATDTDGTVGNLSVGTTVGLSSSYSTTDVNLAFFGSNPGQWKTNSANYFGFSFLGADSGRHYGWMRLDVGADYTIRTIKEVGYSTVIGQSVQIGTVPEPSTVIMGLLASGVTGVIAWRRKRKAV